MSSHKSIANFWKTRIKEEDIGTNWSQAETHCWRCGSERLKGNKNESALEMCHIVPNSRGGLNEDSNLVLLCSKCHKEAPNHTNPKYMWLWIKTTSNKAEDFWLSKCKEEYKKMFGEEFWAGIDLSKNTNRELIEKLVRDEATKTTHHAGEGGLNPSTEAVVYFEALENLKKLIK
jgi:hypothetical protein